MTHPRLVRQVPGRVGGEDADERTALVLILVRIHTIKASKRVSDTLPPRLRSALASRAKARGVGSWRTLRSFPKHSHRPSTTLHRIANPRASSTSSPRRCASAGMRQPAERSFAPRLTLFTFLTSPWRLRRHEGGQRVLRRRMKSGTAKIGGSTLRTRTPRYDRSTGRKRSASEPRYAC